MDIFVTEIQKKKKKLTLSHIYFYGNFRNRHEYENKKSIPRSIVKTKLCNIKCCVVQNTDIDPLPVNSRVYLGKYLVNV